MPEILSLVTTNIFARFVLQRKTLKSAAANKWLNYTKLSGTLPNTETHSWIFTGGLHLQTIQTLTLQHHD